MLRFFIGFVVVLTAGCVEPAPGSGSTGDAGAGLDAGSQSDMTTLADAEPQDSDDGMPPSDSGDPQDMGPPQPCPNDTIGCWGEPTIPAPDNIVFGTEDSAKAASLGISDCVDPRVSYTDTGIVRATVNVNTVLLEPTADGFGRVGVRIECGATEFAVVTVYRFPVPESYTDRVVVWLRLEQGLVLGEDQNVIRWENLVPGGGHFQPEGELPPFLSEAKKGIVFEGRSPLIPDGIDGAFTVGPMFTAISPAPASSMQPAVRLRWTTSEASSSGSFGSFIPGRDDPDKVGIQYSGSPYNEISIPDPQANVPRVFGFEWEYLSAGPRLTTRLETDGAPPDTDSAEFSSVDSNFDGLTFEIASIGGESGSWNGVLHEVFVMTDTNMNLTADTEGLGAYMTSRYPSD